MENFVTSIFKISEISAVWRYLFFFLNVRFVQPFGYGQPNRHITCVLKFEKGKQFLSPSKT